MSKTSQWQSQPYLDALRPAPGYAVTGAILTSYSADLASIVAALLALVGRDNEDGGGGKTDLAEAVEQLRGKVRILIQRGRLARPRRIPPIAGILDQFIHEIEFDEREQSWHPKVSLVQLTNGSAAPVWRLWLGSRNLTSALNRDFGLLLTSASDPKGANAAPIPGTGDLAGRLATYADLDVFRPSKIRTAIDAIRWTQPDRLVVERVTLTTGKGTDKGPQPPDDIDEVIAVSPFLDGLTVKNIGTWGAARTRRSLLSTQLALTKLSKQASKPLAGFRDNLFVLDMPAPEAVDAAMSAPSNAISTEEDEDEQVPVGLHAKIFAVRKARKLRLWVGSANATNRAWSGTNVEVIAEIAASVTVQEGLDELLQHARGISAAVLDTLDLPPENTIAERLDQARKAFVASWKGNVLRDGNAFTVRCEVPPHPVDSGVKLEAGLATGALIEWHRGSVTLSLGEYASSLHTQLLQFRLSVDGINCSWLQCVEVTPPFEEDRDRHAIAHHLGMSAFMAWIAALMAGESCLSDPGDHWDDPPGSARATEQDGLHAENLLTLDAMLACWARDNALFRNVARRIDTYIGSVMAQAETIRLEDRQRLERFQSVWATVSKELLKEH